MHALTEGLCWPQKRPWIKPGPGCPRANPQRNGKKSPRVLRQHFDFGSTPGLRHSRSLLFGRFRRCGQSWRSVDLLPYADAGPPQWGPHLLPAGLPAGAHLRPSAAWREQAWASAYICSKKLWSQVTLWLHRPLPAADRDLAVEALLAALRARRCRLCQSLRLYWSNELADRLCLG